ncbi:YcjX family protein [Aestuariibacter halophilus]|uniref:YcjX family protein n=1 Tax=Fluctibacter halophilus TaxID=226011 RepID=A0ABS8G7U6_9ALTE|nr:YcjX family protein [Aestuariibacter halophilus]MCC2616664.1 YcjX family protein [Aestuariibacter halophilus]
MSTRSEGDVSSRVVSRIKTAAQRLTDQHVSLAVTGLSGSGKTAFITSLINQLLHAPGQQNLPFFEPQRDGRLIGVRRDIQPDLTVGRFAYEAAMQGLTTSPAQWPASTRGISQVRLQLRYRSNRALSQLMSETRTLTLDITDYPGEWLLDLPLLSMDYEQWCQQFWLAQDDDNKRELSRGYVSHCDVLLDPAQRNEVTVATLAEDYRGLLLRYKEKGYQLVQPGRFVLPGELEGAPVLQFFPLPESLFHQLKDDPIFGLLEGRYKAYQRQVVKPFYQQHFKRFDRQIILVDCLSALNQGLHSFHDLRRSIQWIMGSFHYGQGSLIKRLFSPNIDRLVFAASKADHITADQQQNLVKLLDTMVSEARQHLKFDGVSSEVTALAAIQASHPVTLNIDNTEQAALQGHSPDGSVRTLYPGDVPTACPSTDFFKQQGFSFPAFSPPVFDAGQPLPHMRMDSIVHDVLADKMR